MGKQIISTPDAPAAIGTYSQAVRAGNTVWVSGQIPLDPQDQGAGAGRHRGASRQVFENLKASSSRPAAASTTWSRRRSF